MLTGLTQKLWIIKVLFITYMTDNPLKVLTVYTLLEELKNSVWCQSTHLILLPNGIFSMYSSSIQVSLLNSLQRCEKKLKFTYIVPQRKQLFFTMLFFCVSTKWYATRLALLLPPIPCKNMKFILASDFISACLWLTVLIHQNN